MAKRSKFFCIAVEGATCDGRTLDKGALQEMADTYDPKTYTARINMEHIRGFSAEPPFNAYGDVVALETRQIDLQLGGKTEKKLGLFAQVDALDSLVAVNEKGQKLFSSVEINPNFAGTGKAYLQGLAVTDSPASLGTEIMQFAAAQVKEGKDNPFADRKVEKGNFFSAGHELAGFDFETAAQDNGAAAMFATVTDFFKNFGKSDDASNKSGEGTDGAKDDTPPAATPTPTPANDNMAALFSQGLGQLTAAIEAQGKAFSARLDKLQSEQDTLKASIENTDGGAPRRPAATGGNANYARTDC